MIKIYKHKIEGGSFQKPETSLKSVQHEFYTAFTFL